MSDDLPQPARVMRGGWCAAALLAAVLAAGCAPWSIEAPNVVLIVVDDLGWVDTGVYGSSFYETPQIDRLAAEGARFEQFYTASPVCSPTRASLMTGRHPARLQLTDWIGGEQAGLLQPAEYQRQLPLDEVTFGETFRDAGYATGYIGKWHLGREGFLPAEQGFDTSFAVNLAGQPGSYFPPYENPDWPITDVPDLGEPTGEDLGEEYLTGRLTDAAVEFIETHRQESFLLVLSHYAVHTPLQAPEPAVRRYEAKAAALGPDGDGNYRPERESSTKLRQDHPTYAAMIEAVDDSVGRVIEALADRDLDDRTIVVFVSDNGGLSTLTRRGFNQATSNEPLRAGKGWLYEGGIRAPLLIRAPGVSAGTVAAPALSTDLYPTLLDLAGLQSQPEQHLDGGSLVGVMAGRPAPERSLTWHFPHYHGSGNRPGGAIRDGDLKLIEWFEDGAVELYDLAVDPGERLDLAAERPADVGRLVGQLGAWRLQIDANMPVRR